MSVSIIAKTSNIRRRLQTSIRSAHGANINDVGAAVADVGALPGANGVEETRCLIENNVVTPPESIVMQLFRNGAHGAFGHLFPVVLTQGLAKRIAHTRNSSVV